MTQEQLQKLDAMAKPRSKEAITKAKERKRTMDLQEDYCSYEVSRLLEEKGFPFIEHLFMYVDKSGRFMTDHQACLTLSVEEYCKYFDELFTPTITHQMAMKWLRNNHKIEICIFPIDDNEKKYQSKILKWFGDCLCSSETFLKNTYEEAVETALKYVLENLI